MAAQIDPGIAFYDITLLDYTPGNGGIQGLDAVDQWSVGFYANGQFYCQASAARRKQTPVLKPMLQMPQLRGTPAILIVDIYGKRTLWVAKEEVYAGTAK